VNRHQQHIRDVVEDQTSDLPITETPRIETKHCVQTLSQPYLETEVEEVGDEGRHPVVIVKFCRKAMGIYDF